MRTKQRGGVGSLLFTAGDWSPGKNFKTAIGRVYAPVGTGHVDIYQIQLSPLGNHRAFGPGADLSPYRTERVTSPYSLTLHGEFDRLGRHGGTLDVYPVGRVSDGLFYAWPDLKNFWAYQWFEQPDFDRMSESQVLWDEALSKSIALAMTHWLQDELPSEIGRAE